MAEDKKSILSMSLEDRVFDPPQELVKDTYIKSMAEYEKLHQESIKDPDKFWGKVGEEFLTWDKKWDKVFSWDDKDQVKFSWYKGGKLNASVNCLDRHVKTWRKNKAAIIWEADDPSVSRVLTYYDLFREVNKFANVLKKHGVKKGDRVSIYLPMIPELPISMLACARIGAIHSIVFGGFSSDSLRDRINDSQCKLLITSDASYRGAKVIPLKANADAAVKGAPSIEKIIVVNRANQQVPMEKGRDVWWHEEMKDAALWCEPEVMDAEDPLFILYTSGSTGKPKGVLHTTAGFLAYTACSHKWVFDIKDQDTWWCTADIGWVTGHSYIVYGPLVNGATSLMFEGIPTYPDAGRFWAVCDKYGVNSFYTAPTAIRSLMREGESWVNKHSLASLKILGSVGEPINPEAWIWYYENVGKSKCPIMDTYWQTETGGFLITPLPCMKT